MWVPCCEICKKPLQIVEGQPHFCSRCLPFADRFQGGVGQLMQEIMEDGRKRMNRFREQFLQNEVLKKPDALRAVK